MKKLISFSKFLTLPKEIQEQLSTFDNAYITEELSQTAYKKKMIELERALKIKDWWWFMSDSGIDYKKGKSEEDKIKVMRDVLGDDGHSLYKQYAVKSGVVSEGKKDIQPSEYEVFLYKKMKEWKINSLDELSGEAKKRFDAECERDWKRNPDVQVNLPEGSMFPEMNVVQRQGTLGYGDDRQVGKKSLTTSSFCDAGNLYENQTKWETPTPQRTRGWTNK